MSTNDLEDIQNIKETFKLSSSFPIFFFKCACVTMQPVVLPSSDWWIIYYCLSLTQLSPQTLLCQVRNSEVPLYVSQGDDRTQVSDVPQWVQCCVFVMKHYQHRWSRHASCHGTAVYVLPGKRREEGFSSSLKIDIKMCIYVQIQTKKCQVREWTL